MFTACVFFIICGVAWLAEQFSKNSSSSILSLGLNTIIPAFVILLIVYSIIVSCVMRDKLSNFKCSSASKKALCFFIYASLGVALLFRLIAPSANKALEVIFVLFAVTCLITYLVMFAVDSANNKTNFLVAIPKFIAQEIKAIIVFVVATLALGLSIAQILLYMVSIFGVFIGVFDLPELSNLIIVRYFRSIDKEECKTG